MANFRIMYLQSTFATLNNILFYFDAKCTGVFKANLLGRLKQCKSGILDITWKRKHLFVHSSAIGTLLILMVLLVYRVDEPSLK